MKSSNGWITLATVAFVILAAGCEKKDTTVQQDLQKSAAQAGDATKQAVDAAKQAGEKVAQDTKAAGQKVAQDASAKSQEIIDATKKLINDGKLQDALAKLKELGGEKLSAEQKAVADGLKAQIDKLLGTTSKTATDAANAAGNLIK